MSSTSSTSVFDESAPGFWGWIALGAGLVPFMLLWFELAPLWILALGFLIWGRRQEKIPPALLLIAAILSILPGLALYFGKHDTVGAFASFLALSGCVSLAGARGRLEHRIPYLLSFILLMAAGHRTLEFLYLIPVLLFFFSYAMARLGEASEERKEIPRLVPAAFLLGSAILFAIPIFMVMPRTRMSVMSLATRTSLSGFGGSISFGDLGSMQLSDKTVMRVTTRQPMLLRGGILDQYSRAGWKNTFEGLSHIASSRDPLLAAVKDQVGPGKLVDTSEEMQDSLGRPGRSNESGVIIQDILLEPLEQAQLFGVSQALAVWGPGLSLGVTTQGDILRQEHNSRNEKLSYRVYSKPVAGSDTKTVSEMEASLTKNFSKKYLQLPEDLPPRVLAKADQLLGNSPTITAQCIRLIDYFKDEFTYSLARRTQPEADPVDDFLFGDPQGHCEYFASSMAVLLRARGIPSRVVVGFSFGTYNPYSDVYTIRDKDAHAWVEVYYGPEIGWVEWDPTPPDETSDAGGFGESDWGLWFRAQFDGLDAWWQNQVVNYYYNEDRPASEGWLLKLDEVFFQAIQLKQRLQTSLKTLQGVGKLFAAFALIVLGLTVLIRTRVSPWGWPSLGVPSFLVSLWDWIRQWFSPAAESMGGSHSAAKDLLAQWKSLLARNGLQCTEDQTPREIFQKVQSEKPEWNSLAEKITDAYETAVYAEKDADDLVKKAHAEMKAYQGDSSA